MFGKSGYFLGLLSILFIQMTWSLDVFLGGSVGASTWRTDLAIPFLSARNISYYNPQVKVWNASLVPIEAKAKAESKVLLFVILNDTRGIASMVETSEYISAGRKVYLVLQNVVAGSSIDGEVLGDHQAKDINRGRAYLADVAQRHHVNIYSDISLALKQIATDLHTVK